jgi:uncharacterized protein YciI
MATELPDGIEIEPIFVIEATYASDAAERRPAFRPEHLSRLAALRDDGIVLEAGAFTDLSRTLIFVRVANEAAARELAATDVYARSGIWVDIRVRPFGRLRRLGEDAR